MKKTLIFTLLMLILTSCSPTDSQSESQSNASDVPQANLPNPASVYCEEQGYTVEIRTAEDGSQSGYCIFSDGSECDEWAYFRGECAPANQSGSENSPTAIPTVVPVDPNDYQGWWTYTHQQYGFSILLPEDWKVEEITTGDPLMNGHLLNLYTEGVNIRMTFRLVGEDVLLWPTGVGEGEFVEQGTLNIADQPARRIYFVCPNGEINAVYYQGSEDNPNIQRGDLEFGFILSLTGYYCEEGYSVIGKTQYVAEMIMASLIVP